MTLKEFVDWALAKLSKETSPDRFISIRGKLLRDAVLSFGEDFAEEVDDALPNAVIATAA